LHVSDMSWTKKINHPSELLKKGASIECVVLKVEESKQRIALGLKQLHEDPWERAVIENYIPGQIVEGTVTKITNFGVFVELEEDLEGLLHVSELADHKVEDPHEELKLGDKVLVKILRVDPVERKIGLSKKRAEWSAEQEAESTAGEKHHRKLRGGLHGSGEETVGKIHKLPETKPAVKPAPPPKPEPEPEPAAEQAPGEPEAKTDSESSAEARPGADTEAGGDAAADAAGQ
ncbi:MAG: S1 RNA-binding domain-containing protein, partial [Phycisphaerae bacterium]